MDIEKDIEIAGWTLESKTPNTLKLSRPLMEGFTLYQQIDLTRLLAAKWDLREWLAQKYADEVNKWDPVIFVLAQGLSKSRLPRAAYDDWLRGLTRDDGKGRYGSLCLIGRTTLLADWFFREIVEKTLSHPLTKTQRRLLNVYTSIIDHQTYYLVACAEKEARHLMESYPREEREAMKNYATILESLKDALDAGVKLQGQRRPYLTGVRYDTQSTEEIGRVLDERITHDCTAIAVTTANTLSENPQKEAERWVSLMFTIRKIITIIR